ncbi:MAG: hypothetical protein OXI59_19715 [Gemmatimonadota bacterium]|nr:hypothetical protein [Gemmatimonadota bacterium]
MDRFSSPDFQGLDGKARLVFENLKYKPVASVIKDGYNTISSDRKSVDVVVPFLTPDNYILLGTPGTQIPNCPANFLKIISHSPGEKTKPSFRP